MIDKIMALGSLATVVLAGYAAYSAHIAAGSARNAEVAVRRNNRLTSANFVAQSLKEFATDADMQDVFYAIEYGRFSYNHADFADSPEERPVDKLLRHFSVVALMWKNGFIEESDLVTIRYYVVRIMDNPGIDEYVNDTLKEWTAMQNIEHPFHVLSKFAEHIKPSSAA